MAKTLSEQHSDLIAENNNLKASAIRLLSAIDNSRDYGIVDERSIQDEFDDLSKKVGYVSR